MQLSFRCIAVAFLPSVITVAIAVVIAVVFAVPASFVAVVVIFSSRRRRRRRRQEKKKQHHLFRDFVSSYNTKDKETTSNLVVHTIA